MITESTILDAAFQINRARKRCNVWIISAGTALHITTSNSEPKQGVFVGAYRQTDADELGAAIDTAMAISHTARPRITDQQINAVWIDIANRQRAHTTVWICLRAGKLKANAEGPAKCPINANHAGFIGTYNRQITLAELQEDIDAVRAQLISRRTTTARKHRDGKAAA